LLGKNGFVGFQFTAGRTPRAIDENENCGFSFSLNFNESSGIPDFSVCPLEEKIMKTFFPEYRKYSHFPISLEAVTRLGEIFNELGYETESAEYVGEWFIVLLKISNIMLIFLRKR
jgi:hypothetical protein